VKKLVTTVIIIGILSSILFGCSGRSAIGFNDGNPVPMGKSLITADGIEVTVLDVTDGYQAWQTLYTDNEFNLPPANNMQYVLITVDLKNISSQLEPWDYNFAYLDLFELAGNSNKTYTPDQSVVLPEGSMGDAKTILNHGDEVSGTLAFYVPQNENNLVLKWMGLAKTDWRFFQVKAMGTTIFTTPSIPGQVEAKEFDGAQLTPINEQIDSAQPGTQSVDQATYSLTINGLVDHPLSLSYADLESYPQISQLATLENFNGSSFTAKWTGPSLSSIFADAGVQSGATIAIFYTADDPLGYTSLDLSYIKDNNIIIALKDNDMTLTTDTGFPLQVVAKSKYGYKWAKWVTRIVLSSNTNFRGNWETMGYNNNGDIKSPQFQEDTVTVTPSANPSDAGESVTFTATIYAVYPYMGVPTGTVTFKDGNKILGTSTLNTQVTYSTATYSTSLLSKGTHFISAVYVGDAYFTGSASVAIAQIVNK
jgi:DMSO/TMAO reductase YedYZ molybdopterin-dependent catalytic subunit